MTAPPPQRLKSAITGLSEYFNETTFAKFGKISKDILKKDESVLKFSKEDISPLNLSRLTSEVLRYQETYYGASSAKNFRRFMKIPIRLFQDYSVNGSLHLILLIVLETFRSIRKADFSKRREDLVDMFLYIEEQLKKRGFLVEIKLACAEGVPKKSIEGIAKRKGYPICSPNECTHLLYPDPPGTTLEETQGMEYCRSLLVKDTMSLVHWWYYPDCYDSWIPAAEVQGETEEDEDHVGAWHVQVRWLHDTERFNERMNETDYEIPEENRMALAVTPKAEMPAKAVKRNREESENCIEPSSKAQRLTPADDSSNKLTKQSSLRIKVRMPKSEPPAETAVQGEETKILPEKKQKSSSGLLKQAHCLVAEAEDGELQDESSLARVLNVSLNVPESPNKGEDAPAVLGATMSKIKQRASWFSLDTIHRIEKRSLPEFFSNTSSVRSEELYTTIRRAIVQMWARNEQMYLAPSAVKLKLDADLGSIVSVHGFLQQWEIINAGLGHACPLNQRMQLRQLNQVHSLASTSRENQSQSKSQCFACKESSNGAMLQCATQQGDINVCPKCFAEGKYPYLISSRDFRVSAPNEATNAWTGSELVRLLEAVRLFDNDWEKIAAHVGTKDIQACLLHFAKLPLEETLLDSRKSKRSEAESSLGEAPFRNGANPLMLQIGFLAASLSTDISAASAQAALHSFMESMEKRNAEGKSFKDVDFVDLSRVSLQAAANRAKLLAASERRELDRFRVMSTETRLRELEKKVYGLKAIDEFLSKQQKF